MMKGLVKLCLGMIGVGLIGCAVLGVSMERREQDFSELAAYFMISFPFGQSGQESDTAELTGSKGDTVTAEENLPEQTSGQITGLSFELCEADVKIRLGDHFGIQSDCALEQNEVVDGVWHVETKTSGLHWHDAGTVLVTIPEDAYLQTVEMEVSAGNLEIEMLRADRASFSLGAGVIAVRQSEVGEQLDVEVGAGTFVGFCSAPEEISIDCGLGKAELWLQAPEKAYQMEADCGMGSVYAGSAQISGAGEHTSRPQGAQKELTIDCGMGNVTVVFDS